MAQFVHTVRFVLGMAMLVAGVSLVYPLVSLFSAVGRGPELVAPQAVVMGPAPAGPAAGVGAIPPRGGHAIPDVRLGTTGGVEEPLPQLPAVVAVPPPPPPAPLPPSGLEFTPAPPPLDAAYRSTVDIPPPPLLDIHAPPPLAAGWSANDVARSAAAAAPVLPAAVEPPATYVVRDGDDLTGIAIRVYGHAGAASAIWEANRDRLTDPQLLPIGLALRMPPSWTLPASGAASGGRPTAIEPTFVGATRGESYPASEPAAAAVGTVSERHWLGQPATAAALPVAHQPQAPQTPARPAKVWVAAGDSLDSIAWRFYGDRGAAARILQANRDRLRSPELLVPGMELRLP
jgi:nucleoid-associated protein YgaU